MWFGILAIAGARLGAGRDRHRRRSWHRASEDNARRTGSRRACVADALAEPSTSLANILANPLTLLAPALALRVRLGGRIALSGILDPQADAVAATYAPWFTIARWQVRDEWVLLAGERA
jgi:ribosomal protein L11 methyltransferase